MRDVAGSLDVDRIIEDTATLDRVAGELDSEARLWGVKIEMVKIQRVQANKLSDVLAQKKNADLNNKKVSLLLFSLIPVDHYYCQDWQANCCD